MPTSWDSEKVGPQTFSGFIKEFVNSQKTQNHPQILKLQIRKWNLQLQSLLHVVPVCLRSCAARGCRVASLAESTDVPLMECSLPVQAGIWNLIRVPVIACRLFTKDAVTSTNKCWQMGHPISHPSKECHTCC